MIDELFLHFSRSRNDGSVEGMISFYTISVKVWPVNFSGLKYAED